MKDHCGCKLLPSANIVNFVDIKQEVQNVVPLDSKMFIFRGLYSAAKIKKHEVMTQELDHVKRTVA